MSVFCGIYELEASINGKLLVKHIKTRMCTNNY